MVSGNAPSAIALKTLVKTLCLLVVAAADVA
jgi:hypothetical protein